MSKCQEAYEKQYGEDFNPDHSPVASVWQAAWNAATKNAVEISDRFDFARAIEAAVLEAQPTDRRLINLLCRIHRDGGHYITEHGLDKAVEDADIRVAEQNAALDAQAKQEPVAWWCEEYFDDEEEAQNYCDTKAQIAESITPLFATTTNHRY